MASRHDEGARGIGPVDEGRRPSPQLRKWFGHDPARFAEFRAQYITELDANAAAEELLRICAEYPDVTLLYAAKDPQVNHALVLRDYLEDATAAK